MKGYRRFERREDDRRKDEKRNRPSSFLPSSIGTGQLTNYGEKEWREI